MRQQRLRELVAGTRIRTCITAKEGMVMSSDRQCAWVEFDGIHKALHPDVLVMVDEVIH